MKEKPKLKLSSATAGKMTCQILLRNSLFQDIHNQISRSNKHTKTFNKDNLNLVAQIEAL